MVIQEVATMLLLFTFGLTLGTVLGNECPANCICAPWNDIVACERNSFEEIPESLPEKTIELRFNENHFKNPELQARNFSKLQNLQLLFLSDCGIERIRSRTFSGLKSLKQLDLTKNQLKSVAAEAFSGLNMDVLFLSDNPHVQLHKNAFQGLGTKGLMLNKCYLSDVPPELLRPLKGTLDVLWLDDNNIKALSPSLEPIFNSLEHLRLGNNLFHCGCNIRWLQTLLKQKPSIAEGHAQPKCSSPHPMAERDLINLNSNDLLCKIPVMQGIHVFFDNDNLTLSFLARSQPPPNMRLDAPSGAVATRSRTIGDALSQLDLVLDQRSADTQGIYYATASNVDGNTSFSLTIGWPRSRTTKTPTTSTTPTTTKPAVVSCPPLHTQPQTSATPERQEKCAALNSDRKYTLVQVIGAAAGAFCLALILAALCAICLYRYAVSDSRKRKAAAACQAKENLYTLVSQEQRERFLQEERDRLASRSDDSNATSDRLLLPGGSGSLHYGAPGRPIHGYPNVDYGDAVHYRPGLRHTASLRDTGHYRPSSRQQYAPQETHVSPYAVNVDPYTLSRLIPAIPPPTDVEPHSQPYIPAVPPPLDVDPHSQPYIPYEGQAELAYSHTPIPPTISLPNAS